MLKYIEIALPDGEAEENGGLMAAKRRRTKRQEEAEKAENRIKYIRIGVVLGILAAVLVLIFVLTRMGNGGEETQAAQTEAAGQTGVIGQRRADRDASGGRSVRQLCGAG